jgi:uncharacterized protein YqeY
MTLEERLAADLREAAKNRDAPRRSALRLVLAGKKNAEKARGAPLDDSGVIDVIAREAKQHRESITEFTKGNRQDLVDRQEAELAVLLEYLPQQMSREEIVAAARQAIEQVGARGPGDKGKLMAQLMSQVKGKADGREVSDVVSELLSQL